MSTIALELHGTIRHGLWSPERGESRWAQNLAAVLGEAGHRVIGYGPMRGNGWGICPRSAGVELVDWSEKIAADYLIDTACWKGKQHENIRARHVLRGYFGLDVAVGDDWPENHHFVVPYCHLFEVLNQPSNPQRGNMTFLPYVLTGSDWWRRYAPSAFLDVATYNRKRILWGTKDAFGVGANVAHPDWSEAALDLMAGLGLDGWRPTFLGRQSLEPSWSVFARDHEVLKRAESFGEVFSYLPFGQVLQLMRESIVAMVLPTWGSFSLECVFEGCVPVVWDTNPALAQSAREMGLLVASTPFLPARLGEVVDLLLHDGELRALALERYRDDLRHYTPQSALTYWREIERRWA